MAKKAGTILVEMVDGTKVVVPDSVDLITPYVLQEQGDWFEDEIKFLRGIVQPGATVVDIGANYGVYALSLARKVGSSGKVWAFEPASDTAEMLRESVMINATDWLIVEQQALSDRQGTAWLQTPGQSELNSLACLGSDCDVSEVGSGESVSVTTLDACLDKFNWTNVDLLKIDAEGEEDRILLGGVHFFRDLSPLVMFEVKAGLELHLELVDRFHELGYQCFSLIPGLDALAPFDAAQGVDGYLLNLFAAKPDRCRVLAAAGRLIEDPNSADAWKSELQSDFPFSVLDKYPYSRDHIAKWRVNSNLPQLSVIHEAVLAWFYSQESSQPIDWRYSALVHSFALMQQLCTPGCNPIRWASLARMGLALGKRQQAMQAVNALLVGLQTLDDMAFDEPFLCPEPTFDAVQPIGGSLIGWLEASCLVAVERYSSFSGFFLAESALPRLNRLIHLGFDNELVQTRLNLASKRFRSPDQTVTDPDQALPLKPSICRGDRQDDVDTSVRDWFCFIGLERPLRCVDVGALALKDEPDPWVKWAYQGFAEVLGFEPVKDECDNLTRLTQVGGMPFRYLPLALGDGDTHTLYITNAPMTSSLFLPARSTIDLFPALGELMQVVKQEVVQTHRLDDIKEARHTDFLKLDVQGAELMILQNATETLQSVSIIQCEVEFIELYEGQPLMADVDTFLRSQGFAFLRFAYTMGRPFKPLQRIDNPSSSISQALWGDAIYVRDFRYLSAWSSHQLRAAIFLLHELYGAVDLAAFLLAELDRRCETQLHDPYISSLLFTSSGLELCMPTM